MIQSAKSDATLRFWCLPHSSLRGRRVERWLRSGAKRGDPWFYWQLALLLKSRNRKGSDKDEAIRLLKRASTLEYAPAEFSFGVALSSGQGVEPDKKAALYWYRRSASHGFPVGAYNLGHFLEKGIMCDVDKEEAAHWYRVAANMGDSDAEVALGNLWSDHMRSTGSFQNQKWVLFWYGQAAKHGNPDGIFNLALCYREGAGVTQNHEKYMRLLKRAAKAGQVSARRILRHERTHAKKSRVEAIS